MTHKKCCGTKLIYRYKPATEGLNYRWWLAAAGPHLDPLQWAGPADPISGFSLPTAVAPDVVGVSTSSNIGDNATGGAAMRYGIIDGWVWLPDDVTHWRDNNGNTGELGMVLAGSCCGGALEEQPGANHAVATDGVDRTLMDATPITGGWHYIYNPQSDFSAFQGLDLEYSIDGGTSWVQATVLQTTLPVVECEEIKSCDEIPEGWQLKPLDKCCQPTYAAPTESVEIPEQEICTDLQLPYVSNRTSWWNGWTDIATANTGNLTYEDWTVQATRTNTTGKVVDMKVQLDWGNWLHYLRRTRMYLWLDYRVSVNGVYVTTRTNEEYLYRDKRTDTNPDVVNPQQYDIDNMGMSMYHRYNIPAGAVVQIETRARYRFTSMQASGWARLIGGLRSHFSIDWYLQEVVTGRL